MTLTIGAAQSASVPGDVRANVDRHLRFCELAASQGVQLLIFPELSLIGYELGLAQANAVSPGSAALDPLRDFAAQARMIVVAGAPVRNDRGELNITALTFHHDRSLTLYTKQHVHSSEAHVFTSGPGGAPLQVGGASVALAICADASHPQHAAAAAQRGANVYAAGVMIDEPGYTRKAPLMQQYAREHKMAVLMANYAGVTGGDVSAGKSAIWSESGDVVAASPDADEALVVGECLANRWRGRVLSA